MEVTEYVVNSDKEDSASEDISRIKSILSIGKRDSSVDPNLQLLINFDKFLNDLKENMNKRKFRKCLEDIRDKEDLFIDLEDNWKINEIKVKCMLRVIQKKFSKYMGNPKIKGLDDWLKRVDDEVNKWFEIILRNEDVNEINGKFMFQLEICMNIVLEQCYNYALQSKNDKNIADCAAFLALGERLVRYSNDFTNDPENLNISQKILLFISSLLIADKDFETAKLYQATSLRLAYRELYFRCDLEEGLNLKVISKVDQYFIEKIFINIVIAFYQLGVCEENLGSIVKAIEAYKQAKWFSQNFIKNVLPEITQLLSDIEKRAFNYHVLIQNVKNNEANFKEDYGEKKKKNQPKLFYDELETMNKFEQTIKILENLQIEELEEDDLLDKKSIKLKNLLSTVRTINNLMSEKFRGIIKSMDKVQVSKFDKQMKEKIQKKMHEIKSDKMYQEKEQMRKNEEKNAVNNSNEKNMEGQTTVKFQQTSFIASPIIKNDNSVKDINSLKTTIFNFQSNSQKGNYFYTNEIVPVKLFSTVETDYDTIGQKGELSLRESVRKSFSPFGVRPLTGFPKALNTSASFNKNYPKTTRAGSALNRAKPEEVARYKYSEFVFNKGFRNKIEYLDKMSSREFSFQKKLLVLKKYEKIHLEDFDQRKVQKDCEMYVSKVLKSKTKVMKEDEDVNKKKELLNEENKKKEKEMSKLETKVLKSLHPQALLEYSNLVKDQSKPHINFKKETQTQQTIRVPDKHTVEHRNQEHLMKLEYELENLNKIENTCRKDLRPYSARNEPAVKKPSFVIKKDLDNFVKKKY